MRCAYLAAALDRLRECAELPLDVTFVAADMDDRHAAGLRVFDGLQAWQIATDYANAP
jgi:hypothetical protein